MAKDFFKQNNLSYEEFNVASDLEKRKEMIEKSGQLGVPVIDVDGKVFIGFDKSNVAAKLGLAA
ncbi:MAG: hypothetical protein RL094_631 [Candidatus Parcubacteria bacterium]|jgi:glutaredoxin